MEKKNRILIILVIVLSVLVVGLGGYIIYSFNSDIKDKDNRDVLINEEEEIVILNDKLKEIGTSLGYVIFDNGLDNGEENGTYKITRNVDFLEDVKERQRFVMEYILSYKNNYSDFIVLGVPSLEVIDSFPTDDATIAYLDYDKFNDYYKKLFGDNFDLDKAKKGNTSYDKTHVYYYNRRGGMNGVYVSSMTSDNINYEDGEYDALIRIIYSSGASSFVGKKEDFGTLKYIKNIDNDIILKSFSLN